jgi:hypothetical protein
MNLLTMIPIPWDTMEYKFYVGFQVDVVEQPNSVAGKNPGKFQVCSPASTSQLTPPRWYLFNQLSAQSASSLCSQISRDEYALW